jgi:membrane protein YdbS with pleckstrin-like domain
MVRVHEEPGERIRFEGRQHGVVLLRPLAGAVAGGVLGVPLAAAGWPFVAGGAMLLGASAAVALRAVWRWDRTRIVVTTHRLFVVHGTLRRRAAAVRLGRVSAVEVDEPLVGRLLGYGTLVAGDLEIPYVPRPRELSQLVG